MDNHTSDTTLYRIDSSRNMARYYLLSIQPDLFGGFSLLRNWGRIGSGGQMRIDLFDDAKSVRKACDRLLQIKLKRGYYVKNITLSADI